MEFSYKALADMAGAIARNDTASKSARDLAVVVRNLCIKLDIDHPSQDDRNPPLQDGARSLSVDADKQDASQQDGSKQDARKHGFTAAQEVAARSLAKRAGHKDTDFMVPGMHGKVPVWRFYVETDVPKVVQSSYFKLGGELALSLRPQISKENENLDWLVFRNRQHEVLGRVDVAGSDWGLEGGKLVCREALTVQFMMYGLVCQVFLNGQVVDIDLAQCMLDSHVNVGTVVELPERCISLMMKTDRVGGESQTHRPGR